MPTVT
jgi:toxin ParE1/3/4